MSFLGNITPVADAQVGKDNSQSLSLPTPVVSMVDSGKDKTSDKEVLIDDNALTPAIGPMGGGLDDIYVPTADDVTLYVVHKGDTAASLAKMFDISSDTIYMTNGLKKGDALKVGDTLLILPVNGISYTVKKGDTIGNLAKKFSVDSEDIVFFNDIEDGKPLIIGDELIIPNAKVVEVKAKTTSKGTVKNTIKTSSPQQNTDGYFIRPCKCTYRTQGRHGILWHNAVDITSGDVGEPIWAAADGAIIWARTSGWNGGAGKSIMIQHANGSKTFYAHLDTLLVTVGQQVKQGEQIGTLGFSGHVIPKGAKGAHLHFEVSRGFTNPLIANPKYGM